MEADKLELRFPTQNWDSLKDGLKSVVTMILVFSWSVSGKQVSPENLLLCLLGFGDLYYCSPSSETLS
jgi:hypothetical protein